MSEGNSKRRRIFVSYSHKDGRLFQEFRTVLQPLISQGLLEVWDDTMISVGSQWEAEIASALATAKVGVLLVSADFLASDFVQRKELPVLLDAASTDGLTIFWIHVSSCLFEHTAIGRYQAAHDVKQPIDVLPKPRRRARWTEICGRLIAAAAPVPRRRSLAPLPPRPQGHTAVEADHQSADTAARPKTYAVAVSRTFLLAYGDHWCDYPFYDLLDALKDGHGYQTDGTSLKGATLEDLAYRPEQFARFGDKCRSAAGRAEMPRVILISAGIEDIAKNLPLLLNDARSGQPPINEPAMKAFLSRTSDAVIATIGSMRQLTRGYWGSDIPVVVHGYDYVVPDGRGLLMMVGPWIEPAFRERGYKEVEVRHRMMRDIVDRFNAALADVLQVTEHPSVIHLDLRGTLPTFGDPRYREWWANEITPSKRGFRAIADRLHRRLVELAPVSP